MRILILGVSGMLGSGLAQYLSRNKHKVFGTVRANLNESLQKRLNGKVELVPLDLNIHQNNLHFLYDSIYTDKKLDDNFSKAYEIISSIAPDAIINAIGVIKHNADSDDAGEMIALNSFLPHILAKIAERINSRLIQFSTDCIFSGKRGMYTELDQPDAKDLYARTKYFGEISHLPHVLTLRTSFVGHEYGRKRNLLAWFLSQNTDVGGYRNAIYSGLTTVEIARILNDLIFDRPELFGLYHLSGNSINKFDLLNLFAKFYKKNLVVNPLNEPIIDRSLDSSRFRSATGFQPPSWEEMIFHMSRTIDNL